MKAKAYEEAQKKQKTIFLELLDLLLNSVKLPEFERKVGHPKLNIRDILFCCTYKVFTGKASRRAWNDFHYLHEKGYISHIPSHSIINAYMRDKKLKNLLRNLIEISALPLKDNETDDTVCIDSSGFSSKRYLAWQSAKTKLRPIDRWVKAHLAILSKSKIITAIEVTKSTEHDSNYFKPLLQRTVKRFKNVKYCCADKGYSSKKNFTFSKALNIDTYIDFKKNFTVRSTGMRAWDIKARQFIKNKKDYMNKYHRRSAVENVFWMIKSKHFQKVYSKSFDGAVNEAFFKCLIHNLYILTVKYCENNLNNSERFSY